MRSARVDFLFSAHRVGVLLIHVSAPAPFLAASQLTWEQRTNEFPLVALRTVNGGLKKSGGKERGQGRMARGLWEAKATAGALGGSFEKSVWG